MQLNLLFGDKYKEISQVSHYGKETSIREIVEYRTASPIDNLRIIDVPGLATSLRADAQILASLKLFMDTDPDLSVCIPHAVVLVTRFDQSKTLGHPNSNFVRSLKAISLLRARLLDEFQCNLILVLTHYMKGKRRHRVYPQPHLDKFKQIARQHLGLPYDPSIVPGENCADEYQLLNLKDSWRLTSGLLYPENLMSALLSVVSVSKSSLGYQYFHYILQNRPLLVFEPGPPIKLVDPERTRYKKFLEALLLTSVSGTAV